MLKNINNYLTAINNAKIAYVTSQDKNFNCSNIISQEQKVRKKYTIFKLYRKCGYLYKGFPKK